MQNTQNKVLQKLKILLLSAITGHNYETATICGCCQSDWQNILYPTDLYTDEMVKKLEMEYFNTGSEWIIFENSVQDENVLFSMYCYEWDIEEIKKEIAKEIGEDVNNIEFLQFARYVQTPLYNAV